MSTLRPHFFATLVLVLAACQQGQPPTPTPDFEFQVAEALSLVQGQQQTLELTLTRKHGHSEAIQWSLEAAEGNTLPSGLSASFSPNPSPTNTGLLSLSVTASLAAQDYVLRLRARAGSLEKTRPLRLTVQQAPANPPAPGLALSLDNPSPSVTQGGSVTLSVTLNRTNLTQPITLSVVQPNGNALPSGLEASFDPNPATSGSSTLRLNVATGVTAQSYALQVRGVAGGVNASLNFSLEVQAAPVSQTVTVNVAPTSLTNGRPALFYQDGNGIWQPLAATNGEFRFNLSNPAGRYGVLAVCDHQTPPSQASSSRIEVKQQTTAEQTQVRMCLPLFENPPPGDDVYRSVSGRVDGLTQQSSGVMVAMGGRTTSWELPPSGESPVYTVAAFSPGSVFGLAAARYPSPATSGNPRVANKAILIRDINVMQNPNQTLNLDFAGSQAFDLEGPYTINLSGVNLTTSTSTAARLVYWLGNLGAPGDFYWFSNVILSSTFFLNTTNFPYRAIPASRARSGDAYIFEANDNGPQGSRSVYRTFTNAGNLNVPFPPYPNFTHSYSGNTPAASWTVGGADLYNFVYSQNDATAQNSATHQLYWSISVSKNWLGSAQSYTAPNLSNQADWLALWNLRSDLNLQWTLTAQSSNVIFSPPNFDRTNINASAATLTGATSP